MGPASALQTPAEADPLAGLPERIVFFDGICVFCERSVDWLLQRDPDGRLRFASLQGQTAARARRALPDRFPQGLESLVLLERTPAGPRLHLRSQAVRRALELTGGGAAATLLRWLPASLADLGYRAFARIRYRVFGRREACRVPAPHERERFLD